MPPKNRLLCSKKPSPTLKPPKPFKEAPTSLSPFLPILSPDHIYITHIDPRPKQFKRKIFQVPIALNLFILLLFIWRMYSILPHYLDIFISTIGYENHTTIHSKDISQSQFLYIVLRRGASFFLDFLLTVFIWSWPYEFVVGGLHNLSSPVQWRWHVGFRDKEIYIRKSRKWGEEIFGENVKQDFLGDGEGNKNKPNEVTKLLFSKLREATSPMLLKQKTGYLTMDGNWDLDWAAMTIAHKLVDKKEIPLSAFETVVLIYHEKFGWLAVDMNVGGTGGNAQEDARREQVFKFRDALAAVGQEDLFFRWIEVVQFETNKPGGFTPERQVEVAQKIRDLFKEKGIDFDEFWKESVGTDGIIGMD
ncbi:hypothetical protein QBC38DRAFT_464977 [Podospora fimiseda]|uniref:Uncharacterized protein n=1 Tax=Podospora fimiseda TaxID=252190 RepID=A0AAN7BYE3_9PEZI|nr:hypothetical protein QBC38DRAFT_464977 [Podospora fimiseda]